jgi:hypothetical protein
MDGDTPVRRVLSSQAVSLSKAAPILDALTQEHRGTYLLKRGGKDGNSILTVGRKAGLPTLGASVEREKLARAPWLLGPLTLESLIEFLTEVRRPILDFHPLRVVSQQPANLFPATAALPVWLRRHVVLDFVTRTIYCTDRPASIIPPNVGICPIARQSTWSRDGADIDPRECRQADQAADGVAASALRSRTTPE